jgi:integrase
LEETDVATRKLTVHQLVNERIKTLSGSKGTLAYKLNYLKQFKKFFGPKDKVIDVTAHQLRLFLKTQEQDHHHKFGRPLAPATLNHVITVMREVFQSAVELRCISQSPMLAIKYKKIPDIEKRLTPSLVEFAAIVDHIRSRKFSDTAQDTADLVEFMGLAGLGQAECKGLHWGEINFIKKEIAIIRGKTKREFHIPLYPQLLPLLERMRNERTDDDPQAKVFRVASPKAAMKAACGRLRLPDYTPRSLRRLFIQTARRRGIPPQYTAKWQGHKNVKMVLKVYDSGTDEEGQELAKLMKDKPDNKSDQTKAPK